MHQLGYTSSYTELRSFLTSVALHMVQKEQRTQSGSTVPSGIKPHEEHSSPVLAAADNWDHNENTADGKNTTHAMTSILVYPKSRKIEETPRIAKSTERIVGALTPGTELSRVLQYQKPNERPCPILRPPPRRSEEVRLQEPKAARLLKLKDLMYNFGRLGYFCDDRYEKPWTVFQSNSTEDKLHEPSEVLFNPIIMANPTHYDTVYTTLKRFKEQLNPLGQKCCPVTFDMGLLRKALEVVWSKPEELEGIQPMDGGMHFLMAVFAGIGYLYGDIGLKQLLSESDVFAPKTAQQILAGKDFDRGLRAFLMIDEVLTSRLLTNFRHWCQTNNDLFEHHPFLDFDSQNVDDSMTALESTILPLLQDFIAKGRELSPNFLFWDNYLKEVSTPLKLFLSSSRHAIWDVYEYSKSQFLPFFFAANRTLYARYMPYMTLQMQRLPTDVKERFLQGNFMAKLTEGKFNSVWMDYCLEVTENKSLKSNGGIIGLTHRDTALRRWFLARPVTAKYSHTFTADVASTSDSVKNSHHTDRVAFKKSYNEDIQKMADMFEQTFIDPFSLNDPPTRLVNMATGVSVSQEVEKSLLSCFEKASASLDTFVEERLVVQPGSEAPQISFYQTLPKVQIKTFTAKAKSIKIKNKDIALNGEEMYIRLLSMNSFKKVPLKRVMSFENSPVPLSLFTDEGEMMVSKKSDCMHILEKLIPESVSSTVDRTDMCVIYDGMAVVQMLQPTNQSVCVYREMAESFWHYILSKSKGLKYIHVVPY